MLQMLIKIQNSKFKKMKKLLQFITDDGNEFYVEVQDENPQAATRSGTAVEQTRGVIQNAANSFENALKPLKEVSNKIFNSLKDITNSPDEVQVELGLKFSAKAGIILTSLDSEANFKIILKWQNKIAKK